MACLDVVAYTTSKASTTKMPNADRLILTSTLLTLDKFRIQGKVIVMVLQYTIMKEQTADARGQVNRN